METWESPTHNLPPIRYEKREDRKLIEQDTKVKKCIDDKFLLDKEFNSAAYSIMKNSKMITLLFEHITIEYWESFFKNMQEKISSKFVQEFIKEQNREKKENIIKLDKNITETIEQFENNKKITNFDILENHTLIFCKDCNSIVGKERFRKCVCKICNKKIDANQDCEELIIHIFGDKMKQFVSDGIWLEHGINNLLSKKGFKTFTGTYVLGNSGVRHEIDNFAENLSDNIRLLGECKDRDIKVNDILVLSGKMTDTGVNLGYVFTTSSNVNKDIRQLARFRNIAIIDSLLEKEEQTILNLIK